MEHSEVDLILWLFCLFAIIQSIEVIKLKQLLGKPTFFLPIAKPTIVCIIVLFSIALDPRAVILLVPIAFFESFSLEGLVQGGSDFIYHFVGICLFLCYSGIMRVESFSVSLITILSISYLFSGIGKLKNIKHWWVDGLQPMLNSYKFELKIPILFSRAISLLIITFEIGFIYIVFYGFHKNLLILFGLLFHIAISYFMGLTRFLRNWGLLYLAFYLT